MRKLLLFFIVFLSQLCFSQSDCISAIPVCGNSGISYTPSGSGTVQEDLMGCLSTDEHYSVWYSFTIATAGTLTFEITPNVYADDYDFGVYGPNQTCGALSPPIRCNYSGLDGPTGLTTTLTGTATNGTWSAYMDVLPGETYYLVVDNYSHTTNGFSLTWGGTATLASAFNDPTLAPNPFIPPGVVSSTPGAPNEILKCQLPSSFDFTTLSSDIINGNPNFSITYHNNPNDALLGTNPLTTAMVDATTIYYYRIHYQDPTNPNNPINNCAQTGEFKFRQGNIVAKDATLFACNNNNAGTGSFNLTLADTFADPTATKKYYPTLNDLTAGTNEITNITNYVSAEGMVYVKVTSSEGCSDDSVITLSFYPTVVVNEDTIEACYIESNILTGAFDLTAANITAQTGVTKKFYTTFNDAVNGSNEIGNPTAYISTDGQVYAKVFNANGCYAIAKITLQVLPPVKSNVLKDQTICMESRTTLDAGPGFDGYEWSTGATTQSISGVGVGAYWVKLQTGFCYTLQEVNVYASQQPVISTIDISNNTITVNVAGGTPPYQYSLDGINWQDSNIFTGLPRGENKIYVKDSYDCIPVEIQVTVPNLLNAITPNGDNINDVIDYSALSYKKNLIFIVYDRYGNKLYEADKMRNYSWDGTAFGKKIPTGTYWYTISWNENDKNKTPTRYNGWILVKNRE